MNPFTLIQTNQVRVCRWCEKTHESHDSFCSEQCRSKFNSWLETEHATIRGKRPTYWNMIRRNALIQSGNKCQIFNAYKDLSVHHIIPLSNGGDSTSHNLRVLCRTCHSRVHGRKGPGLTRKKKFRIRIRYQPLYIPGILACNRFWEENSDSQPSTHINISSDFL